MKKNIYNKYSIQLISTFTIILFVADIVSFLLKCYSVLFGLSIVFSIALFIVLKLIEKAVANVQMELEKMGMSKELHSQASENTDISIITDIIEMVKRVSLLISLLENMNQNTSFPEMLQFINKKFSTFIPYNYIGVALIDNEKNIIQATYGVSDGKIKHLPENLVGKSMHLKETSLEQVIHSGQARIINDLEEYVKDKPLKLYNKIILDAGIKASITLPLKVSEKAVGVIFFSSSKKNVYSEEHVNFLKIIVNSLAINFNQNIFIDDLILSSTLSLAKLAEARDEDTGEHLERMKIYSKTLTEILHKERIFDEISIEYIEMIERFSPLHDIGKVGIRDGILLKQGKLTDEEFKEMKSHTLYGAEVLKKAEENIEKKGKHLFSMGIDIALNHHEKWDGSGYPYGKKADDIPLCARIVAVADVFDALTSKRPYKEAFPVSKALSIIEDGNGKHFDPRIADCFLKNKEIFISLYESFK